MSHPLSISSVVQRCRRNHPIGLYLHWDQALSRGLKRRAAHILAKTEVRKSQSRSLQHLSEQASEGVHGQDVMVGAQTPLAL
jgi:hypothetical protein